MALNFGNVISVPGTAPLWYGREWPAQIRQQDHGYDRRGRKPFRIERIRFKIAGPALVDVVDMP